jgi:hypothetical protein
MKKLLLLADLQASLRSLNFACVNPFGSALSFCVLVQFFAFAIFDQLLANGRRRTRREATGYLARVEGVFCREIHQACNNIRERRPARCRRQANTAALTTRSFTRKKDLQAAINVSSGPPLPIV